MMVCLFCALLFLPCPPVAVCGCIPDIMLCVKIIAAMKSWGDFYLEAFSRTGRCHQSSLWVNIGLCIAFYIILRNAAIINEILRQYSEVSSGWIQRTKCLFLFVCFCFIKSLHSNDHFVLFGFRFRSNNTAINTQNVISERAITLNTTFHHPSSYVLDITGLLQAVELGHGSIVMVTRKQWYTSYKEHWILRGTERFVFVSLNRGRGQGTMRGGGNKVTMRQSHWQCQGNTKSQSESWAEINKMSRSQKYFLSYPLSARLQLRHLSPDTKHYDLSTWQNITGWCSDFYLNKL